MGSASKRAAKATFAMAIALASASASFVTSSAAAAAAPAATPDAGQRVQKFVEIATGGSLFVDYILPKPGKPTVILLNGLTYRTGPGCWTDYANQLARMGYGVFMYDMRGQGRTLERDGLPLQNIGFQDQAADLNALLDAMGFAGPQHFFTLSYGTEIGVTFAAEHPERVKTLILSSAPDGPLKAQDDWVRNQIAVNRAMVPFNPASYDDLYAYFYRLLVYATYPSVEPIVMESPIKLEAVYRMGLGVKPYEAADYVDGLPAGTVFQIDAGKDQYLDSAVSNRLWNMIPASARMARITVDGSEHKFPEAEPLFAAQLTKMILDRDARLAERRSFIGYPRTGQLQDSSRRPGSPGGARLTCDAFVRAP